MKIIKQTVTELMVQTRGVFDFWLPSCLLITFGLIWMALNYEGATLKCDRLKAKQSVCQLMRWGLLGSKTKQIQLAPLRGAKVEKLGYSNRLILMTDGGEIPFTSKCTNGGKKNAMASDINYYVKNQQQKLLNLSQDDRWLGGIGGIFVLTGIGVILLASSETYSFARNLDSLIVKEQRLFVPKVTKLSLSNISGVEVGYTKDRDNDTWYEVRLLVLEGDNLYLPNTMSWYESVTIAKAINNYLSQRAIAPNLYEVCDARDLDAVLSDSQLTQPG